MRKNILVINSYSKDISPLFDLLEAMSGDFKFRLLSSNLNNALRNQFNTKLWKTGYYLGWFSFNNWLTNTFFVLFYPFFIASYFIIFFAFNYKFKLNTIICISLIDKFIFSIPANLFKCKVIWLELPDEEALFESRIAQIIYKVNLRFCDKVLVFNDLTMAKLMVIGARKEGVVKISTGFEVQKYQHQDDLFNGMVARVRKNGQRYFTIGVIADLVDSGYIKILFQAVSRCLEVIPNIQVVIIGDGEDKKTLSWLAKTMKLDNLVWFVGRQLKLRKWIDNFDCFILTTTIPTIVDLSTIYAVMYGSVPIIAQRHVGLENLMVSTEGILNTLIDISNHEMLAKKIIEIEQDAIMRSKVGELEKQHILKDHNFEQQVLKIRDIIK